MLETHGAALSPLPLHCPLTLILHHHVMLLSTDKDTSPRPSPTPLTVTNTLPPLPTIRSTQLLEQIFTHSSLSARPRSEFEAQDDPMRDNEGWVLPPSFISRLKSLEGWRTSGIEYLVWRLPILFKAVIHVCTSAPRRSVEASSFASSSFSHHRLSRKCETASSVVIHSRKCNLSLP